MTRDFRQWWLDDGTDVGGDVPRRPAAGKVSLTQHIPVQRKARVDVRPARESSPIQPFAFVQAYGGEVKQPNNAAFPDENPVSWLGAEAEQASRAAFDFDFKPIQRVANAPSDADTESVQVAAARGLAAPASSLPHLEQIQKSFGRHDVTHVQAHVGGAAAEASAAIGAEAYATGDHVAFHGAPSLHTAAHEAAHVVQQKAGVQLKGGVGADGDVYERHADAVADKVVAGESAEALLDQMAGVGGAHAQAGNLQRKRGAGGEPPPPDTAPDKENAFMTVRAFDGPGGVLIGMWTGEAWFFGPKPSAFAAQKQGSIWRWTGNGGPVDRASLKIHSDKTGKSGEHVEDWAPAGAKFITVDYRSLALPFGAGRVDGNTGDVLPGASVGMFKDEPASGSDAAPDAGAPSITGPGAIGVRRFDELEVIDHRDGTIIQLGDSRLEIGRNKGSYYSYQIEPQQSPRQRVVRITATLDTFIKHSPGIGPVELAPVKQYIERPIAPDTADALGGARAAPEVSASGDWWRVSLRMGRSVIHIEQEDPEGRFAYFVDPEWNGEERTVHIVATPGVRVDQYLEPGLGAVATADARRLVASPIRVQDARLVPDQGAPIDPAQYLSVQRHESANGLGNPAGFTVATGASGVTVRDLSLGATMTIRTKDPSRGARYLHDVDGRQFRALVGPGVSVDIVETRPMDPDTPHSAGNHLDDFQNVDFLIYEARSDQMPSPGTVLTKDVLEQYGAPRKPDSHEVVPVPANLQKARAWLDISMGVTPGVGDAVDYLDFFLAVSKGHDHWGQPVSLGETLLLGLSAVLPFLTWGAIRAGKRALKAARMATDLGKLAAKVGRTEEEIEAILAALRRMDPEAQTAAKRIEKAIKVGDNIDPRDFEKVNDALAKIGSRTIPLDSPRLLLPGPADAKRIDPVDDASGGIPTAPPAKEPVLIPADRIQAKEKQLQAELARYVKKMGATKQSRGVRVEVIDAREFKARYGDTEKARAKFTLTDKGPVITARIDATPADMMDEAAHIAQLGDPKLAGKVRYLDEKNLSNWSEMSAADRLEFYQTKLDVEIDAKERTIRTIRSPEERLRAQANLDALRSHQATVADITPERLARMNSGEEALPDFLDTPAHLFGKRTVVDNPSVKAVDGQPVHGPAREVSRTPADKDYSHAYGDDGVTSVLQHGHAWKETTHTTSGYDGKIASRTVAPDGSTTIVVKTKGGHSQSYVLEKGTDVPEKWTVGAAVKNGDVLGVEPSREYRRVEVTYSDGRRLERQEILSTDPRKRWVQRGSDSTAKGEVAEDAARNQADADLAARTEKGELTGSVRLPHQNPNSAGGGFDDVLVEFTGSGDDLAAKIRIREVKDYGNRHVPLQDFTALRENHLANMEALNASVDDALLELKNTGKMSGAFASLSPEQVKAIKRQLEADKYEVEVVLGPTTKLGDPGHHASTTIPALERQLGRKVKVERISDANHSAAAAARNGDAASGAGAPGTKTMAVGGRSDTPDAPAPHGTTDNPRTGEGSPPSGDVARRGGPYREPGEVTDWNQPTRALDDSELAPIATLNPTTNGKELLKGGSFAIGKPLDSATQGHTVLDLLSQGDTAAFHMIGMRDVPKKLDAMKREWALVQTRDGFVIFAGEPGRVVLPNNVRVVGHTHPRFRPDERGREAKLDLPDDHPGIEIQDLVGNERMGLNAGLLPSAEDIPNIADGTNHVLHTRFVRTHDGKIANPADEMGLEARSRVKAHLSNTRVVRYNPDTNIYFYVTEVEYWAGNDRLWKGQLYTKAGNKQGFGTRQVTLYEPAELKAPLPKGWVEP